MDSGVWPTMQVEVVVVVVVVITEYSCIFTKCEEMFYSFNN